MFGVENSERGATEKIDLESGCRRLDSLEFFEDSREEGVDSIDPSEFDRLFEVRVGVDGHKCSFFDELIEEIGLDTDVEASDGVLIAIGSAHRVD